MSAARERNRKLFDGVFGSVYGFYMERPWLVRPVARVVWGSDARPFYSSMVAITQAADGTTIVDCPCGSGVALRALRPSQQVRYIGFDLSPGMLARASRRAAKLGLEQPDFEQADASKLPLESASVDIFLSYFGLHCLDDPEAAIREAARCLRTGGLLVGSSIVRGPRRLDGLRVRPHKSGFGAVGDEAALHRWFQDAALRDIRVRRDGNFAVFSASR